MRAFLIRDKWRTAFIGYTLYIIYGTTLPFRFTLSENVIARQLDSFFSLHSYQSLSSSTLQVDGLSNILFFIPFGLFFFSMVYRNDQKTFQIRQFLLIILSGSLLSTFVEVLQIFTVNRSPSVLDIITNTVGTYIGAYGGYLMVQKGYREKLHTIAKKLFSNPDITLLSLYALYLILAGLAPFNFNLSPFNIYRKLGAVTDVKFSLESHPAKIFGILYLFAPAGYLVARTVRRYTSWSYFRQTVLVLAAGLMVCIFVEFLQLFIRSRYFSWSDIGMGWIGVLYGMMAYQFLHRELYGAHIRRPWSGSDHGPRLFYFFVINYLLFIFYKYLYPFEFDTGGADSKISFFFLNLYSYFPSKNMIDLLSILLKNTLMFIPAGIIFYEDTQRNRNRLIPLVTLLVIFFAKSLQLINAHQTPLLYDLFGMTIGAILGYILWLEIRDMLFQKSADRS